MPHLITLKIKVRKTIAYPAGEMCQKKAPFLRSKRVCMEMDHRGFQKTLPPAQISTWCF